MLQTILLSFNAVSALIPVMLIGALILAAAGLSRGKNLFTIFSLGVIFGATKGIGGGSVGKGLKKRKPSEIKPRRGRETLGILGGFPKKGPDGKRKYGGVVGAALTLKQEIRNSNQLKEPIKLGQRSPLFIGTTAKTAGTAATIGAGYAVASKAKKNKGARQPLFPPAPINQASPAGRKAAKTALKIAGWSSERKVTVAASPFTTPTMLAALSKDKDNRVRAIVAENPHTDVWTLEAMRNDIHNPVKRGLARNPNTHFRTLVALSRDKDDLVRENVARNPHTDVWTLGAMRNDTNLIIAGAAAKTLAELRNNQESQTQTAPPKIKFQSPLFARHNQIKRVTDVIERARAQKAGNITIDNAISALSVTAANAKRDALAKGLTDRAKQIDEQHETDIAILQGAKGKSNSNVPKTLNGVHEQLERFSRSSKQLSAGYRKLSESTRASKHSDAVKAATEISNSIDKVSEIGLNLKILDKADTLDLKRHMLGNINQIKHPIARLAAKNIALKRGVKINAK